MIINSRSYDAPISKKREDELARSPFAERFARLVTSFSGGDRSNIFALYGEWGSGKTSTWTLIRVEIDRMDTKPLIVEFSPWAYSSYDQVVGGFFHELLVVLRHEPAMMLVFQKMAPVAHFLTGLGSAALMAAGADPSGTTAILAPAAIAAGAAAKVIAKEAKAAADRSLTELRADVAKALIKVKRPILILVDDVDRLPPAQVTALFQLVRVNASLPLVNYLLLMDREMVEGALEEQGFAKSYLEKIVQFGIDLPRAASEDLHAMAIRRVMHELEVEEKTRLKDRFEQATKTAAGLLDTPRAIGQVAESFGFLLEFFRNDKVLEVDPVDLFLLELLRCRAPRLYAFIRDEMGSYGSWDAVLPYLPKDEKAKNKRKERLESVLDQYVGVMRKALQDVFDALLPGFVSGAESSQDDFAECRLCSSAHFRNYFELTVPREHPSQAELESVVVSQTQRVTNSRVLALIDRYGWDITISALQAKVRRETTVGVIGALTSSLWIADRRRLEGTGPGAALLPTSGIGVLTVSFLRRINDIKKREQILRDAWTESGHFGLFYRVVAAEQYEARRTEQQYESIFPPDTLKRLRREAVGVAKKVFDSNGAMQNPMLTWLLAYNSQAEGPDAVFSWIRSLLADRSRLAGFLCNVIRLNRQGDPEEKLELNLGVLASYFAIDASLLAATEDTAGLSEEYAMVIQQAHAIALAATTKGQTTAAPSVGEFPKLLPFVPDLM
jgi:hypothetical protein